MENQVSTKTIQKTPNPEELYRFIDRLSPEERDAFIDSLPDPEVQKFTNIVLSRKNKQVVNEQHPAIDDDTRFVLKNVGDLSVSNVQKMFPDLDVSIDDREGGTGEIIVRDKNESTWRKLEKAGSPDTEELAKDIKDIYYDVPAAAASWYAPLAGAVKGAGYGSALGPLGTFGGAIGGGVLGGAVTEAGLEGLKQLLGKFTNTRGEFDLESIKDAAKWGGALSLLGVGRPTKAMGKWLAKRGLAGDAVVQPFRTLGQAARNAAQSVVSGIPMEEIALFKKYYPELVNLENTASKKGVIDPVAELVTTVSNETRDTINRTKDKIWKDTELLFPVIDSKVGGVNIAEVRKNIDTMINGLENKKFLTPMEADRLNRLREVKDKYFFTDIEVEVPPAQFTTDILGNKIPIQSPGAPTKVKKRVPIGDIVPAERAQAIKTSFYSDASAQTTDKYGKNVADKLEDAELKKLGGMTSGAMKKSADAAGVGGEYERLNKAYASVSGKDKFLYSKGVAFPQELPDEKYIAKGAKSANADVSFPGVRKAMEGLEKEAIDSGIMPSDYKNKFELLRTLLHWHNPKLIETSQYGSTSTGKLGRRLIPGMMAGFATGSSMSGEQEFSDKLLPGLAGATILGGLTSILGSHKGIRATHGLARPLRLLRENTGTVLRRGAEESLVNKYLNNPEREFNE